MPSPVLGILGTQQAPAAATNADVYTVPAARRAVISTLVCCNTTAASRMVRVFAREAGAASAVGNAIVYDVALAAGDTLLMTLGITLAATDIITVQSNLGGVTFTAFGEETDVPL